MPYVKEDGTALLKIIDPGKGSSGWYPEDVLRRDGHVFEGVHCYIDHPTKTESRERPERSVRDLAAVVNDTPQFMEGPDGPGLYANCFVLEHWRPVVESIAPYTGNSIRASGDYAVDVSGKRVMREGVPMVERLTKGHSVDFVTHAGRGGKLVLSESQADGMVAQAHSVVDAYLVEHGLSEEEADAAQFVEAMKSTREGSMELQEALNKVQELETTVAAMTEAAKTRDEELTRLQEQATLQQARDMATKQVGEAKLHQVSKDRLVEAMVLAAPVKEGVLDAEAFKAAIEEAVKKEEDYLRQVAPGASGITGMGEAQGDGGHDKLVESMTHLFNQTVGDPEKAKQLAEIAAGGR